MFSSCVIYCDNFNSRKWTDEELNTLLFYHYKFDVYAFSQKDEAPLGNWLESSLVVRRVVAELTASSDVKSFFAIEPKIKEWVGNFDIFIDFPQPLREQISAHVPNRHFVTMVEAGQ